MKALGYNSAGVDAARNELPNGLLQAWKPISFAKQEVRVERRLVPVIDIQFICGNLPSLSLGVFFNREERRL